MQCFDWLRSGSCAPPRSLKCSPTLTTRRRREGKTAYKNLLCYGKEVGKDVGEEIQMVKNDKDVWRANFY